MSMFTLKLYRRSCPGAQGPIGAAQTHMVVPVMKVIAHEIGEPVDGKFKALELRAKISENDWVTYYVGEPQTGMQAFGRDDLHLDTEPGSWWGWGLLENWEGNTSEHYRPASYG